MTDAKRTTKVINNLFENIVIVAELGFDVTPEFLNTIQEITDVEFGRHDRDRLARAGINIDLVASSRNYNIDWYSPI